MLTNTPTQPRQTRKKNTVFSGVSAQLRQVSFVWAVHCRGTRVGVERPPDPAWKLLGGGGTVCCSGQSRRCFALPRSRCLPGSTGPAQVQAVWSPGVPAGPVITALPLVTCDAFLPPRDLPLQAGAQFSLQHSGTGTKVLYCPC